MYVNEISSIKSKIIHEKNGIKIIKNGKNNYNLSFYIENNKYVLSSIINLDLIGLIYKLNEDIYESIHIEKINENEINITLVMKRIFMDIITQRYAYLNIKKEVKGNNIIFSSNVIKTHRPTFVGSELESVSVDTIINTFEILSDHKLKVECDFIFLENRIPGTVAIFDRVLANIISKMFFRFKNFIEILE